MELELDDMIFLGACALLGGNTGGRGFAQRYEKLDLHDIDAAVEDAKRIWDAVIKE